MEKTTPPINEQEKPTAKATALPEPSALIFSDIGAFLHTLIVNSWVIILAAAIGGAASYLLVQRETKLYESYTSVIVSPRVDLDTSSTLYGIDVLNQNVVGTYVQILGSQAITELARARLMADYDQELLDRAELKVRPIENSTVIVVTVRSENPELARDLANEIAAQTIQHNPVESLIQAYPIKVLDEAALSEDPVSPQRSLSVLFGVAGGAIIGVGFAFLLDGFVKVRRAERSPR